MKKLTLLAALVMMTGCAPFSGFAVTSGVSAASGHAHTATFLTPEGEAVLMLKIDKHLQEQTKDTAQ